MAYKNQKKNKQHIIELKNDPYNFRYKNAGERRDKRRSKYLAMVKNLFKKGQKQT